MFNCFKKRDRGPVIVKAPKKDATPKKIQAVILIPGHTAKGLGTSRGMTTYNGIAENDFNANMVRVTMRKYRDNYDGTGIQAYQLVRREDSYAKYIKHIKQDIKQLSKDIKIPLSKILVIEMHLNAAGIPEARGGEAIVVDHKSALTAYPIIHAFSTKFNIRKRHHYRFISGSGEENTISGIKMLKSGARGSGFLKGIRSIGCLGIIWEPCFADYASEESRQFFDRQIDGVALMSDFWIERINILGK